MPKKSKSVATIAAPAFRLHYGITSPETPELVPRIARHLATTALRIIETHTARGRVLKSCHYELRGLVSDLIYLHERWRSNVSQELQCGLAALCETQEYGPNEQRLHHQLWEMHASHLQQCSPTLHGFSLDHDPTAEDLRVALRLIVGEHDEGTTEPVETAQPNMPESLAAKVPSNDTEKPPAPLEYVVNEKNHTITYGDKIFRWGGNSSWAAFLQLWRSRPDTVDLYDLYRQKDLAGDIRKALKKGGMTELATLIKLQSGFGHYVDVPK